MSDEVFNTLLPILPVVGWVCDDCVSVISVRRKSIQSQLDNLSGALQKLEQSFVAMEKQFTTNVIAPSASGVSGAGHTVSSNSISQAVSDALRQQQRRQRNIIVSGLPETSGVSDADKLREICEQYLNYKPWFDDAKCRRIGKSSPRRLLVSLPTPQAAAELILVAKKELRKADSLSIAARVYINPDLSPEEAHQAFLKRKERREKRVASGSSVNHNTQPSSDTLLTSGLNPDASSFPFGTG
jgi:hypothetical protein